MTLWNGYMGIENLNLNDAQRGLLVEGLLSLGQKNNSFLLRDRMQLRVRADNQAAIFEAWFDTSALSITAVKNRLANIFNINASSISADVTSVTLLTLETPVVTFSRLGTDYLRVAVFGGTSCSWDESRLETIAYLAAHASEWNDLEVQ